mgnify:CR=1 FL=1
MNNLSHIAIVGLGSIGRRHLRLFRELRPELEITLVRSGIGQSWPEESLAQRKVFSISEAINAGAQAAIISSPSPYHIEQSLEFASSGVHLLIEKPLSHNIQNVNASSNTLTQVVDAKLYFSNERELKLR